MTFDARTKQDVRDAGAAAKAEIDAVLAALDTPGYIDDMQALYALYDKSDIVRFLLVLGKLYG